MQAQEYGVEVKSTAKEEEADSKPVIKSIERDSHHADKPPREHKPLRPLVAIVAVCSTYIKIY